MPSTVAELLDQGADQAVAIVAPGRPPLDHAALRRHVGEVAGVLAAAGLAPGDRVASVLPGGPEAATAFLATASSFAACPLNQAYKADELAFYLGDLKAKAMILAADDTGPAAEVAARLGLRVLRMAIDPARPAGLFTLDAAGGPAPPRARPEQIGLLLHTSGTTSRPKIVPLAQANLAASAGNIARTLQLTAADRCLNVMPLFHIHGLIAGVLAPLAAGSSVAIPPGFNALKFFAWMEELRPSWYTAVPTMHQAVLSRAERNRAVIDAVPLRFIRSSSAAMPITVIKALEDTFGAPVIESYGMTEAAHQMASNPLPPAARKPGTVGRAAGPEIAVMDPTGPRLMATGQEGEIVIRGPNVTPGYENNPTANAAAFTEGWFRTGDLGVMDDEGYLSISGRLKEIINRGGEKIAPREVDEVLMEFAGVAQAVCFAMPHDKLGEEVAAAVVLDEGAACGEQELRDFVAKRLAAFKVPRRIVIVAEIPKGATGKLQRIGLAQRLGLV